MIKHRRSLTHVGGQVETSGNRQVATQLASALDVAPSEEATGAEAAGDEPGRAHVHGFHTYPARMHPVTAARLVRSLSAEGATVLDPFCGSGTVLVEAAIAGRRAIGTDLNPLAVKLATLKTTPRDAAERNALIAAAAVIAAGADERRKRRAGATRRYPQEDVDLFPPHVLLELDSLRAGIAGVDAALRETLLLVLSSILVKVSRRTSDTSSLASDRRIAAGFPARLFLRKTEELARRIADLADLVPAGTPAARVTIDDATCLRTVSASTVDAVVTSPPYVATYDYLAQHAARLRWLGLSAKDFAAGEIGARRRYVKLTPDDAIAEWRRELGATLRAMSRVCRRGARVALLVADSAVRGGVLRADEQVRAALPDSGLTFLARASQRRPHFHEPTAPAFETAPRAEHVLVLEKR